MLDRAHKIEHALLLLLALAVLPACVAAQSIPPERLELEVVRVDPAGGAEEFVVQMLLPLAPGSRFDPESMLHAQRVLESSGYFETVDMYTGRGSKPGAVVLFVDAKLDRSAHLETGFGYEPADGWYLNLLGVRWNNQFGRGGHLQFGGRLGQRTAGLYAEASHPRLGGSPLDLRLEAGTETEEWLVHDGSDLRRQDIERNGLHVGLRSHWTKELNATLWAGVSSAFPRDELVGLEGTSDEPTGRLVPVPDGRERFADLRLDVTLDRRDGMAPWRRGVWMGARFAASDIHGGASFYRSSFDARLAVPVFSTSSLALRTRGIHTSRETPYHLRPVAGGNGTFRGFRDASLSGPLGARSLWHASAEWRRPLVGRDAARPRVVGLLFVDVGQHWDANGVRQAAAAGAGYGVRVRVPWIHLFGLDAGVPLTDDTTGDPFWVHGTLGFSF